MSIDAMKQALEALETLARYENPETKIQVRKPKDGGPIVTMYPHKVATDAATVLRTAIAEAEKQEPVAWANINKHGDITHTNNKRMPWSKTPLYTTPPAAQRQWVSLEPSDMPDGDDPMYDHDFFLKGMAWADAILRKKNATPPAAQRQPLTDEKIWLEYQRFWPFHPAEEPRLAKDIAKFARAIEAAHGIKGEA